MTGPAFDKLPPGGRGPPPRTSPRLRPVATRPAQAVAAAPCASRVVRRVLVVDDSRVQRRILRAYLTSLGYEVLEAVSGRDALAGGGLRDADLVISDWVMPEMDGLQLCRAARRLRDRYVYFILLTSKSGKDEAAQGLEGGADDFLAKPVGLGELRARIAAGERILAMHRTLRQRNEETRAALRELSTLYEALDRDLIEARRLQQSLIREPNCRLPEGEVALLLRPAGHVGGDLVGFYRIGGTGLGLYGIDVSGHGVASALLTARVAGYFAGNSPDRNIALRAGPQGSVQPRDVAEVAASLNARMIDELETGHYFSMLLAHIDLPSGRVSFIQAGHPGPLVQGGDGRVRQLGDGGLPIGLIPSATYQRSEVHLQPGERLLIVSDGFAECRDPDGRFLRDAGLIRLVEGLPRLGGGRLLEALLEDLTAYAGGQPFGDDISAALFDYRGPAGRRS